MRRLILFVLTLLLTTSTFARDAAQLQLAIRKLGVVGGALYIAAHPDDENTAMLAWLSNERMLRTGYLSITRGDGGQNLIGDEKGPLLGVIRTQELLAARNIDGAEQMFTRAIDFGYSKSADETLRIWGREQVLSDVVWAIRKFQPDVIVMRFPVTGEGGHGQHTASALLAEEAFEAAADPKRFPEQLAHAGPWRSRRIFWNRFSWRPVDPNDPALAKSLRVDLGTWNALLGRSYTEIAAASRTEHKSQGFGSAERRGSIINYFDQRAGEPATKDLFEGVPLRWARFPGGERLDAIFDRAAQKFDPDEPAASVPVLLEAYGLLEQLRARPDWSAQSMPWFETKRRELLDVIRDCAGLAIDVAAAESAVVPGADIPVSVSVVNRSDYPFRLSVVASLHAQPSKAPGVLLENNKPVKTDLTIRIPKDAEYSQPYWLEKPAGKGLYTVDEQRDIGRPDDHWTIPIVVTLDDAEMHSIIFTVPAVFRRTDPVLGEQVREVDVVPPVAAKLTSGVYLFSDSKARPVTIAMQSFGPTAGSVSLEAPAGWKVDPASHPLQFAGKGAEQRVTFQVTPPATESTGLLTARTTLPDGTSVSQGIVDIIYPHIPAQRVFVESTARLVRTNIRRRGERVGYIMGSGDEIPQVLRQVGYEVVLLSDEELDRGDFSSYDAVVAGIRAYNTRTRLSAAHARLMEYVEKGGTYVVQYNTLGDLAVAVPGPYPFKISQDRVTVEEAPVTLLAAEDPLLTTPNRITAADFDGWVQERGLYFPSEWDERYRPLLASNDPGESEKRGGLLTTRHGKGVFVYTGYAWWRQLPAGVPGAIKAFVNLVSAR
jgi:LmbE family N-acetylglucosaminyl deacetylase